MDSTDRRRRQRSALVAALLAQALAGWALGAWRITLGTALSQLLDAQAWHSLATVESALLGLQFAAAGVGAIGAGLLADRRGRQRVLVAALLAAAIAAALSATAFNATVLGLTALISAFSVGATWVASAALMVETCSDGRRGRNAGLMVGAASLGLVLAVLGWTIASPLSMHAWRGLHLLGVLGAPVAAWIALRVREPRRSAAAIALLDAHLRAVGLPATADNRAPDATRAAPMRFPLASVVDGSSRRRRIAAALVLEAAVATLAWSITTSVPSIVGRIAGTVTGTATLIALGLGSAAGAWGFGRWADREGRRRMVQAAFAATLAMSIVMVAMDDAGSLAVMAAFVLGLAVGGAIPWTIAWLPELYSTRMRASAMGLVHGLPRILLANAVAMGAGRALRAQPSLFAAVAIAACAVGIAAAWTLRDSNGTVLPE